MAASGQVTPRVRGAARSGRRGTPLAWLGLLLAAYLAYPLGAFAVRLARSPDRGFAAVGLWPALRVSIESSTISLALSTVLGIPLAYALVTHPGRLSTVIGAVVQLPLALPPLMGGLLLIYIVGPYSHLGRAFQGRLTDTLAGVVIAQTFVSAPFLIVAARSAFATVDPALDDVAAVLGHGPLARFFRVDVRCAAPGIRAGMVLTWLRAFGEYGATVIIAYHPFSLPIYTANQFSAYPLSTTQAPTVLALGAAALAIAAGQLRPPGRREPPLPPPAPPVVTAPTAVGFDLHAVAGTFHVRVAHAAGASRLAIVGPSGSGKSLTLRALAGLLGPGAGTVEVAGQTMADLRPEHRRLGYVPQGSGLIPGLTVRQQVLFGVHADPARAAWWLSTLHLEGLLDRRPDELSGGERQRVSLARALAGDPAVVLLDEPFSALDAPVRDELRREFRRLQRENGLSTVLVTHDPVEAAFLADEIVVISGGVVLQAGPVGAVYRQPRDAGVARLLGIDNVRPGFAHPGGIRVAGSLVVPAGHALPAGTPVWWVVAPTSVAVRPAGGAGLPGTVLDVIEIGASVEVTVRLEGGLELRSTASNTSAVAAGTGCAVVVEPGSVRLWASGVEPA